MTAPTDSVARAVDFIEAHLCEDIAVEEIAAQAALYSPFHFTRLFSLLTGETPGGYLRKRRLSEAARDLLRTRRSILQIGLAYCFRSGEAFSRSFKRQFGLAPDELRRTGPFLHLIDPVQVEQIGARPVPAPRFREHGLRHFAGLPYHGDSSANELAGIWADFGARIAQIPHRANPDAAVGIWEYPRRFQPGRDFDYTAAVEVERFGPLPPGLGRKTLPPGRWAAFEHTGPLRLIRQTYVYIYAEWLPHSGLQPAGAYDLEVYDRRFLGPEHPNTVLEIALPVR